MPMAYAPLLIFLFLIILTLCLFGGRHWSQTARRSRLMQSDVSDAWIDIVRRNVPPFMHLAAVDQERLLGLVRVFLAEKSYEGCGGLELTEEIKVTIAAEAALLVLHRKECFYEGLQSVLVYPSTYVAGEDGGFNPVHTPAVRLGESWTTGVVVLAWDSVKRGAFNSEDGQNVALHEFAHQLDSQDGRVDGAPRLDSRSSYGSWAKVLSASYAQLTTRATAGQLTVLDDYGASNPAEFFAVATETFFEKPAKLYASDPALFNELKSYYHLDPREWTQPNSREAGDVRVKPV